MFIRVLSKNQIFSACDYKLNKKRLSGIPVTVTSTQTSIVLRASICLAVSPLPSAVLSGEEFVHPAGLLRSPQRLPAVWIRRLDSGENRPSGAAREPRTETRGPRQPGRGPPKTAHTQTLQLKLLAGLCWVLKSEGMETNLRLGQTK